MRASEQILKELEATGRELLKTDRALKDAYATIGRLRKENLRLETELAVTQHALEQATGEKVRVLHRADERSLDG